jgi:hypothetical protein
MRRCVSLFVVLVCSASCTQEARQTDVAVRPAPPGTAEPDESLSEREKDYIRQQIQENWILDVGMAGLEAMTVQIEVAMNPDGSVQTARIDPATDNGNPNWRSFAQSCLRAVLRASPLRMPAKWPYAAWKRMTLVFNGREMANL